MGQVIDLHRAPAVVVAAPAAAAQSRLLAAACWTAYLLGFFVLVPMATLMALGSVLALHLDVAAVSTVTAALGVALTRAAYRRLPDAV